MRQGVKEPGPAAEVLLDVQGLEKHFRVGGRLGGTAHGFVRAVDGVSFSIRPGEVFGLLGESGCGKTTVARIILGLIRPTAGEMLFEGVKTSELSPKELRRRIQIIFQDPHTSLNPSFRVRDVIGEALRQTEIPRGSWAAEIDRLLRSVGLTPDAATKYPGQLSGGQNQRVGIARALAMNPKLIIADEPVSALDVSIQAQILNLFIELKEEFGLTYLFISHDFNVVRYVCDRIAVMYLGRIAEFGDADDLFRKPLHPYTEALLAAVPRLEGQQAGLGSVTRGEVPSSFSIPCGCRYHPRCHKAQEVCGSLEPPFEEHRPGGFAACHFAGSPTAAVSLRTEEERSWR
jgi:peptide/nickel transport system ATP-binding protein